MKKLANPTTGETLIITKPDVTYGGIEYKLFNTDILAKVDKFKEMKRVAFTFNMLVLPDNTISLYQNIENQALAYLKSLPEFSEWVITEEYVWRPDCVNRPIRVMMDIDRLFNVYPDMMKQAQIDNVPNTMYTKEGYNVAYLLKLDDQYRLILEKDKLVFIEELPASAQ